MSERVAGRISSTQTLGTLDGPGVRYVAFLQGCPLCCGYCHNPEARPATGGRAVFADELVADALKYREYFGKKGGITLSGGEPLLQTKFSTETFALAKRAGITTCLDTSGVILSGAEELLRFVDYCLLDVKFSTPADYVRFTGGSLDAVLDFLALLEKNRVRTRLRRVVVEGLNDKESDAAMLAGLKKEFSTVEEIELLPMRKFCLTKYRALGLDFPFDGFAETSKECLKKQYELIDIFSAL